MRASRRPSQKAPPRCVDFNLPTTSCTKATKPRRNPDETLKITTFGYPVEYSLDLCLSSATESAASPSQALPESTASGSAGAVAPVAASPPVRAATGAPAWGGLGVTKTAPPAAPPPAPPPQIVPGSNARMMGASSRFGPPSGGQAVASLGDRNQDTVMSPFLNLITYGVMPAPCGTRMPKLQTISALFALPRVEETHCSRTHRADSSVRRSWEPVLEANSQAPVVPLMPIGRYTQGRQTRRSSTGRDSTRHHRSQKRLSLSKRWQLFSRISPGQTLTRASADRQRLILR